MVNRKGDNTKRELIGYSQDKIPLCDPPFTCIIHCMNQARAKFLKMQREFRSRSGKLSSSAAARWPMEPDLSNTDGLKAQAALRCNKKSPFGNLALRTEQAPRQHVVR